MLTYEVQQFTELFYHCILCYTSSQSSNS